jgi:hypothetical protein
MTSVSFLSCKFFAKQKTYETIAAGLHAGLVKWLSHLTLEGQRLAIPRINAKPGKVSRKRRKTAVYTEEHGSFLFLRPQAASPYCGIF